ncbi:MAG: tetratricopeptide repeat protein [Pseudomonadota bacterium]
MSLLMEALRKAEQAKKQAAGPQITPVIPVKLSEGQDEQVLLAPQLALEVEESPLPTYSGEDVAMDVDLPESGDLGQELELRVSQEASGEDLEAAAATADAGGQENFLSADDGMADVLTVEAPALSDLDLARDTGRATDMMSEAEVPGESENPQIASAVPLPSVEAERTGPAGEPEHNVSDVTGLSVADTAIASAETSRQTARTVFTAKKEHQRRNRNRRMLVPGIVAGIVIFGMAGFLFFSYRAMNNSTLSVVTVDQNMSPQGPGSVEGSSSLSVAEIQPSLMGQGTADSGVVNKAAESTVPQQPNTPDISATPRKESPPQAVPALSSPDDTALQADDTLVSPAVLKDLDGPLIRRDEAETQALADSVGEPEKTAPTTIVITHRALQPQLSPLLAAAYAAYQNGDFEQARRKYQQVLQDDPHSRDALLGLAAIAMRRHEISLARDLYLRLLDQDPGDSLARAGLLAIAPTGDPVQQESELKLLLELHPNSAPLFFSLGSLYAAGQRWSEAQQAYFNALQAAKIIVPDYPFNLAVSLEHLGQLKPAVKYYRQALQLAGDGTAGFDVEGLRARLKILEQGERP